VGSPKGEAYFDPFIADKNVGAGLGWPCEKGVKTQGRAGQGTAKEGSKRFMKGKIAPAAAGVKGESKLLGGKEPKNYQGGQVAAGGGGGFLYVSKPFPCIE